MPYPTQLLLAITISVVLAFLMACGGSPQPAPSPAEPSPNPEPLGTIELIAPFSSQSDIGPVNEAFSASGSAPWGFQHNGIDFFPVGDLKAFRAAAAGTVQDVAASQNNVTSNWQVGVTVKYDSTWSIGYAFEPMTTNRADGDAQMAAITVANGQHVAQGQEIGCLRAQRIGAHVHFGLLKNREWICPEPYFTAEARQAILDRLRLQYPGANMCY